MTDETVIHIVCGTSGEYSDRTEWVVRAFFDESQARAEVDRLTEAFFAVLAGLTEDYDYIRFDAARKIMQEMYDPNFPIGGSGDISYYLQSCPLAERGGA